MKSTTLITGATGFIGKQIVEQLLSKKNTYLKAIVRSLDKVLPSGIEVLNANLLDDAGLKPEWLSDVEVVIHCAARVHVLKEEAADPSAEFYKMNRDATLNLAKLAAQSGVKRFVFISTVLVNGNQSKAPFTESDGAAPVDAYALSKYEAEQGLFDIAQHSDMEIVIIRSPLVYGPFAPANFARLVKWVNNRVPLPLGAVQNRRSFIALDNLVDFILLCSERKASPKAANQLFLISDGEDVSTSSLLKKVANAYDVTSRLFSVPVALMTFFAKLLGKPNIASSLFGDLQVNNNKARDLLGWKPVTTMDRQLSKMAELERGWLPRGQ